LDLLVLVPAITGVSPTTTEQKHNENNDQYGFHVFALTVRRIWFSSVDNIIKETKMDICSHRHTFAFYRYFRSETVAYTGGKPACVFEYVHFGTDADVREDVQCGKPIHAHREVWFIAKP